MPGVVTMRVDFEELDDPHEAEVVEFRVEEAKEVMWVVSNHYEKQKGLLVLECRIHSLFHLRCRLWPVQLREAV